MQISENIPAPLFPQFHRILCTTGGRYVANPHRIGDIVRVHYTPGDHASHCLAWERVTTPLRETYRSTPLWRKIFRKIMLVFRRG